MAERSVLLLLIFISVVSFCYCHNPATRRCNTAFSCSFEEKPVWATTTGHDCLTYRNGCFLLKANCDRINRYEQEAVQIDREQCQSSCSQICPPFLVPVCAFHNEGKLKTFGNQCEMENYICKTGLTFSIIRAEACPEHLEFPEKI